jgi:hypothetical protein
MVFLIRKFQVTTNIGQQLQIIYGYDGLCWL